MQVRHVILQVIAVALMTLPSAGADDARTLFDSLYGDELKKARATADGKDDIALAEKLIASANSTDAPKLIAVLCETSYDLADKRNSPALAAEAMRVLMAKAPAEALGARDKLNTALRKQYNTARGEARTEAGEQVIESLLAEADDHVSKGSLADAIAALRTAIPVTAAIKSKHQAAARTRLDGLIARQQSEQQLARLREKVLASPNDAAAQRELARMLFIEFDDPAKAAPHAQRSGDDSLKTMMPLAAKAVNDVSLPQCLELGDWLRGLSAESGVSSAGKVRLLKRARACYDRYASTSTEHGLSLDKAKLLLGEVNAALAKLEPSPAATDTRQTGNEKASTDFNGKVKVLETLRELTPEDGVLDITKLIYVDGPMVQGVWSAQDGKISLAADASTNFARSISRMTPTGDYELEFKFERGTNKVGASSLSVSLPVGWSSTWLMLGAGNDWSGLDSIDGRVYYENATATNTFKLTTKRLYTARVSVKLLDEEKAHVLVTLDGKTAIDWKGARNSLPINRSGAPPVMAFGTFGTLTFHRVAIRAVTGKIQLINVRGAP